LDQREEEIINFDQIYTTFYDSSFLKNDNNTLELLFGKLFTRDHKGFHKIYAHIIRIKDFNLKAVCRKCNNLLKLCSCSSFINKHEKSEIKIEFKATFVIHDYSSILDVIFQDMDYDISTKVHTIFTPISSHIQLILTKYLNEIKINSIPKWTSDFEDEQLCEMNRNIIYHIHNYLYKTIISDDKHFIFHIEPTLVKNDQLNYKWKLIRSMIVYNENGEQTTDEFANIYKSIIKTNCYKIVDSFI
jgi:hypothetical protein